MKNQGTTLRTRLVSQWKSLLENIVLFSAWAVAAPLLQRMNPRELGFFCDDVSIWHPVRDDTVSSGILLGVTLGLPALLVLTTELTQRQCRSRHSPQYPVLERTSSSVQPCLSAVAGVYLSYFFGFSVLNALVMMLKKLSGRLRPSFGTLCQPQFNNTDCQAGKSVYISDFICMGNSTTSRIHLQSARQSFPSGHAALSIYMALFIIFYIEKRLSSHHHNLLRVTLYILLTSWGLFCCVTRVTDFKHFWSDVTAGAALGALLALVLFFRSTRHCLQPDSDTEDHARRRKQRVHHTNNVNHRPFPSSPSNNNNNNSITDDDDISESPDVETPSTPTPLLMQAVGSSSLRDGFHLMPSSFRLETDKKLFRKFSLR